MNVQELREYPREWLTVAQVAPILGCDPQALRVWAKQRPQDLGFPVVVMGTRVKIPREPFIRFMTGK